MVYRNIPIKPELFKKIEKIRQESETQLGLKFSWNFFIETLVEGPTTTIREIIIDILKKNQQKIE